VIEIREYHDRTDHSPFRRWLERLNAEAARKVTIALYRLGLGNFSNVKVSDRAFLSAASILGRAIGFILQNMARAS
jgi:hypothetical protein